MRNFIFLLIILVFGLMSVSHFAEAAPQDLNVTFETVPLFSDANVMPGDSVTRFVRVNNTLTSVQNIATEAVFVSDPQSLGSVIMLYVHEGSVTGTLLVSKPLSQFFEQGETFLSSLAANSTTTYYYTLSFLATSSDIYQSATLGFDLVLGTQGSGTPTPPVSGGGIGGGSGGGGNPPPGLSIINEFATTTDISTTTAFISWTTSYKSTSRVVYSTSSGVFVYSTSALSNYGYTFSTAEQDSPASTNGVLSHGVLLTGLTAATTYYYRAISHASPDTVSREFSFTTGGASANSDFNEQLSGAVSVVPLTQSLQSARVSLGVGDARLRDQSAGVLGGGFERSSQDEPESPGESRFVPPPLEQRFSEPNRNVQLAALFATPFSFIAIFRFVGVLLIAWGFIALLVYRRRKALAYENAR